MNEYKRKPNTNCNVCGAPIYRRPGVLKQAQGVAYCSRPCYGQACRKETPCLVCGVPILAGANKKTCSRACANTNRTGITYKSKTGPMKDKVRTMGILKQRLRKLRGKYCERCTYDVYEILQVHHKDRNRNNNEYHNLELLCPNCHAKEHYLKK